MKCGSARLVIPVVIALLLAVSSSAETPALSKVYLDHDLKATFLIRLMAYVSWPSARPADPGALTICLVGKNKLNGSLVHYRGRTLEERVVRVRELRVRDSMAACDIVYLSRDESRGGDVLAQARKLKGVLTVSDREDFACGGGMVRFLAIGDRLALEVNRAAAADVGLRISSQLLAIAKVPDLATCAPLGAGVPTRTFWTIAIMSLCNGKKINTDPVAGLYWRRCECISRGSEAGSLRRTSRE